MRSFREGYDMKILREAVLAVAIGIVPIGHASVEES